MFFQCDGNYEIKIMEHSPIVAPITPNGTSAIAVIRISGEGCINYVKKIFRGADLSKQKSHTITFGDIVIEGEVVDEVLISIFLGEKSFTKEDSVEISCHGSQYIVEKIIKGLLNLGVRLAQPGEFSKRAFLNGRFSLAQAEAIADIIHADSTAAHKMAISQLKGSFECDLKKFREKIIEYAALLELELDFSQENEIFVNRDDFKVLLGELHEKVEQLISSFNSGKSMKEGIATAIIGKPNVGKSSLLNNILKDDRAIISKIAGTTRDVLQENIFLGGVKYKLIDTAGLRENTDDEIEKIGIQKTYEQIEKADIILVIADLSTSTIDDLKNLKEIYGSYRKKIILCGNKCDIAREKVVMEAQDLGFIITSAIKNVGIEQLEQGLMSYSKKFNNTYGVINNVRHYHCLHRCENSIVKVKGMIKKNLSSEFLVQEVKEILTSIGEITGEVTTEDLLNNIFSKFCIGK